MIRYNISLTALQNRIDAVNFTWRTSARSRTMIFSRQGSYKEDSPIWSEIKSVYMDLQYDKCIFCERKLEDAEIGLIEQDVEHFRPKKDIKAWRPNSSSPVQGIPLSVPPTTNGYYKLAYHLFNYAASCKPCNSILKKSYFPIAGQYNIHSDDPVPLTITEQPYLIYPISDFDDNPEQLIKFNGVSPFAIVAQGHGKYRALVTIEIFKLDGRKNLSRERASIICMLYGMLMLPNGGGTSIINALLKDSAPHANCARSFYALFQRNRQEAERIFNAASALIDSIS